MKSTVLIDGENFVHSLVHALRLENQLVARKQLRRFRLDSLLRSVVGETNSAVQYYATRLEVPSKRSPLFASVEAMRQWNARWVPYIANQGVTFIKAGSLKLRDGKPCRHCGHKTQVLLEKGVDVRLGVDLVSLATKNVSLYLFSSDSDLIPAVTNARQRGATVTYIAVEGVVNQALARASSKTATASRRAIVRAYREANK